MTYDSASSGLSGTDAMTVALFVLTVLMMVYVLGLRQPRG